MRVLALLAVLAVGASASTHALSPSLIKDIASHKIGEQILLELQASEEAAPSLEGLLELVAQIRERIENAQAADDARAAGRDQQCNDDIYSLRVKINNTILAIKQKQGMIAETSGQIGRLTRAIQVRANRIARNKKQLGYARQKLSNETRTRYTDNAIFQQSKIDTEAALSAVAQILDLEWDLLLSRQDDEASQYQEMNYKNMATLLQVKASQLSDGMARSLMELTAVAVQNLSADDVDRLKALLEKLQQELETYKEELINDEEQAAAEWETREADLRDDIQRISALLAENIAERLRLIARRSDAESALEMFQKQWSGLKEQYTGKAEEPGALELLLAATLKECENWEANYASRTATRTSELETVSQIEGIIEDKMSAYRTTDTAKFTD